jgi:hypothetical protein
MLSYRLRNILYIWNDVGDTIVLRCHSNSTTLFYPRMVTFFLSLRNVEVLQMTQSILISTETVRYNSSLISNSSWPTFTEEQIRIVSPSDFLIAFIADLATCNIILSLPGKSMLYLDWETTVQKMMMLF